MSSTVRSWATLTTCAALIASLGACAGDDPAYTEVTNDTCTSSSDCALTERCENGTCVAGEEDAGSTSSPEDTGAVDTAAPMDTSEEVGVGTPCDDAEDCPSGYCIEAAGSARRICTDFCDPSNDTCPDGFTCAAVGNSGADVTFLCFPETELLCQPCEADSDCGGLSDRCLDLDDGTFCGRDCELQACPDGFTCTELTDDDGSLIAQCSPTSGFCSACLDPDEDEFGVGDGCLGGDCDENNPDINEGAFEICNGEDDDCDDQIDEGFNIGGDCDTGDDGICAAGTYICDAAGMQRCEPNRAAQLEVCNGEDDDCDGTIDEGNPGGGGACNTGAEGVCGAGNLTCTNGQLACEAIREASEEVCNGRDDNCDGRVDEGNPGGGAICDTGEEGICGVGEERCQGSEVTCVALNTARPETCNGEDDNCDGRIDEGNPGGGASCLTDQPGICAQGTLTCQNGGVACVANAEAGAEVCNGLDDDCDGTPDNGFDFDNDPNNCGECGETCQGPQNRVLGCSGGNCQVLGCAEGYYDITGDAACEYQCTPQNNGVEVCNGQDDDCDGQVDDGVLNACGQCGAVPQEVCDGVDNDCNGVVDDNRVCGSYIQQRCRLFIGYADNNQGPAGTSSTWSVCPGSDRDNSGDLRCVGTRRDGNFARLQLTGEVDSNDRLAPALLCDDTSNPGLASYIQSHCALFIGHADNNEGVDDSPSWGACPPALVGNTGDLRCTSSGYDGRFRFMNFSGGVDDNDSIAIAWICRDDANPARAAAMQESANIFMGYADNNRGPADGSPTWDVCPGRAFEGTGDTRCVSTQGDGLYHRVFLKGDVDGNDQLGWALRAR